MGRKRNAVITLEEELRKIKDSKVMGSGNDPGRSIPAETDEMESIDDRIKALLNIVTDRQKKRFTMLFFVMYDIESTKVRNQIVKYLIRSGCHRIQKSIFLADLSPDKFHSIKEDLAKVQACYDNRDSILIVPISTDHLQAMKIIGQNINIDIITKNKHTLFF